MQIIDNTKLTLSTIIRQVIFFVTNGMKAKTVPKIVAVKAIFSIRLLRLRDVSTLEVRFCMSFASSCVFSNLKNRILLNLF